MRRLFLTRLLALVFVVAATAASAFEPGVGAPPPVELQGLFIDAGQPETSNLTQQDGAPPAALAEQPAPESPLQEEGRQAHSSSLSSEASVESAHPAAPDAVKAQSPVSAPESSVTEPVSQGITPVEETAPVRHENTTPGASHAPEGHAATTDGHGEEHGEEHGDPLADVYKGVNTLILFGVLAFLLVRPMKTYFANRTFQIREELEEARNARARAEQELKDTLAALASAEKELENALKEGKAAAAREREEALRRSAEEIARIEESSQQRIRHELSKAQQELREFVVHLSSQTAEESLRKKVNAAFQDQLIHNVLLESGEKETEA